MRRYRGGDRVLVRMASFDPRKKPEWVAGRVLRAPCEWREGFAVTVDCDDGVRRFVEPARMRPELRLLKGGHDGQ